MSRFNPTLTALMVVNPLAVGAINQLPLNPILLAERQQSDCEKRDNVGKLRIAKTSIAHSEYRNNQTLMTQY